MIEEGIKKLLDSELEADNLLGWEMIEAKKIPFKDVMDYVEKSRVPTHFAQKYIFDGKKFIKNPSLAKNGGSVNLGNISQGLTMTSAGNWTSIPQWDTTYTATSTFLGDYEKFQESQGLDKQGKLSENLKADKQPSRGGLFSRKRNSKSS